MVIGIGGTLRPGSSTEKALRLVLSAAEAAGAETCLFGATHLGALPMYNPEIPERTAEAQLLVETARSAVGVVIASPGYHGTVSGLVKNALDYFEDMRNDEHPYLDGRAVGCVATAMGWQAAVSTLTAIRSVAHALRGWPTPMGAAVNTAEKVFDAAGGVLDARVGLQLAIVGQQVAEFARYRAASPA